MSTTIDVVHISTRNGTSPSHKKHEKSSLRFNVFSSIDQKYEHHLKNLIHSFKVGLALVLVSLLYILDPLFEQVGENAMWAIMTIEVIFEFFAGATLSKGLLRGIGTVLGGGLGCLATILTNNLGKIENTIVVGILIFTFGSMATFCRFTPSINKKYDYGVVNFILTFNLVAASGLHAHEIMELAHKRLSAVGMGFSVCIFISLLIFPMWASDELHQLTSSRFDELASCIEECMEAYFCIVGQKESRPILHVSSCKSVLYSKSSDESLVNFARWEPCWGNFGFCNPWEKHQKIADLLRGLASIILSMQQCLESPLQPSTILREGIKEPCQNVGLSLGLIIHKLGESVRTKKRNLDKDLVAPELQAIKLKLMLLSTSTLQTIENIEDLAIANFLFLLLEIVDKVEVIAKEVEKLESGCLISI
uniref:aluminum-activated malate transporter 2-like n=1 Tax=Erigeron canadensis TaxID=72917 RepID=UPI001CB8C0D3|nr:aluminum-activated malate transporter 2-like [Erigeron canadensis]